MTLQLTAKACDGAPEIVDFEPENHVGVSDQGAAALGLIQRMARREIHAPVLIDHRALAEASASSTSSFQPAGVRAERDRQR